MGLPPLKVSLDESPLGVYLERASGVPLSSMVPSLREERSASRNPDGKAFGKPPSPVGILVLDPFLKPVWANAEAVRILVFPSRRKGKRLDTAITDKLPPELFGEAPNGSRPRLASFNSGNRGYLCRAFSLDHNAAGPSQPAVVMVIERSHHTDTDFARVAAKFGLTRREQETVGLLLQGLTSKEIGASMAISPNTVKAFLRTIMLKMGCSTRAGVIGKFIQDQP